MRRNVIGIVFISIVAVLALWFIVKSGYAVCSYYHLSERVSTTIEKWSVEEIKSDQFAVVAYYSYIWQGRSHEGKGQVGDLYPNPWAANRAQKQFSNQQWPVWIDPSHPERGVLEKAFPYKKAISATILVALLIYFAVLGIYVRSKNG